MKLLYKAISKEGKPMRGVLDAKDEKEAVKYLRARGMFPVTLAKKKNINIPFLRKSGATELVFFTRQLSSMIASGLTLMQSLSILQEQVQNPIMQEAINAIVSDIQEGKTFSSAIAKHPSIFPHIYISLIKAAESSGFLDKVLLRLADNLEKQEKLKGTIKSALMYPVIVVIGIVIVTSIMMIFVIPQLSILYDNLNVPLPLPTQIVVGASKAFAAFWPLVVGFAALVYFLFRRWYKTEAGGIIVDDLRLRLPVFGKLIRQTILAEFSRTLGLLVGAGTLVVDSMNQTSEVAGNAIYRSAISDIARRIERGLTIGDAMSVYPLFPPILVQMVRIGEQTGKLDESLLKVSEYFEREVEQTVKTLTTAMEPFIMIILGLGVAFLIISVITPIYNLTSSIQ